MLYQTPGLCRIETTPEPPTPATPAPAAQGQQASEAPASAPAAQLLSPEAQNAAAVDSLLALVQQLHVDDQSAHNIAARNAILKACPGPTTHTRLLIAAVQQLGYVYMHGGKACSAHSSSAHRHRIKDSLAAFLAVAWSATAATSPEVSVHRLQQR